MGVGMNLVYLSLSKNTSFDLEGVGVDADK
jgi:hypothetical protein